jgi:hypothetical protein
MHRRSRRSFLVAGLAAAGGYGFWRWISHAALSDGLPYPLRLAEQFNATLSRRLLGVHRQAPTFPASAAVRDVRVNGDIGLDMGLMLPSWRLQLTGLAQPHTYPQFVPDVNTWKYETAAPEPDSDAAPDNSTDGTSINGTGDIPQTPPQDTGGAKGPGTQSHDLKGPDVKAGGGPINIGTTTITITEPANPAPPAHPQPGLLLTMDDLRALPHVELINDFKCIEGWSEIVHWGGVRFADLIARYQPINGPDHGRARYVSLETPDGGYYVGIDMADALHPQTLLCYEINNQPLTMEHGAPLRLVIPLKYGIKHLKQIGRITFTNERPRDYWAEQGYDWDSGH